MTKSTGNKRIFKPAESLSAWHKVAVLMVALGEDLAGEIMRYLDEPEIEELTQALADLKNIPTALQDEILLEFEHEQSHGESFLALLMNRFSANGFYLLDEPEAALSPNRQMAVLSRIHDLAMQGSQFIIATHSPILMAYPNSLIYHLTDHGTRVVAYRDTEHYSVTKAFLNNPEKMLGVLMEESDPKRTQTAQHGKIQ